MIYLPRSRLLLSIQLSVVSAFVAALVNSAFVSHVLIGVHNVYPS